VDIRILSTCLGYIYIPLFDCCCLCALMSSLVVNHTARDFMLLVIFTLDDLQPQYEGIIQARPENSRLKWDLKPTLSGLVCKCILHYATGDDP
jgi:hypothetical protein